jgi:hypothetical protein
MMGELKGWLVGVDVGAALSADRAEPFSYPRGRPRFVLILIEPVILPINVANRTKLGFLNSLLWQSAL